MILFGLVSTVFDLATFAVLRLVTHADAATFRTAWFVVSLLTELAALLVLRTARPFWRRGPSPFLLWSSVFVAALALALPYSGPIAALFAFRPLSPGLVGLLVELWWVYALGTEFAKRRHGIAVG
jgi:Mg2+-importing ATPase